MIFFHQLSVGRQRINMTVVVIMLGLFLPWGCHKRQELNGASRLTDSGLEGSIQFDAVA